MLEESIINFGELATDKQIKCVSKVDGDLPPKLLGDRDKIQNQIIGNLVSNAIKFTDQGSVTVGMAYQKHSLTISVTDTGRGIAKQNVPKIFARQLHTSEANPTGHG